MADEGPIEIIRGRPRPEPPPIPRAVDSPAVQARIAAIMKPASSGWKYTPLVALPAALLVALVLVAGEVVPVITRNAMRMPVHELGHAVTAWICGHPAVPSFFITHVFGRGWLMPLLLGGAMGVLIWFGSRKENGLLVGIGVTVLLLQMIGTFLFSDKTAQAAISFGGEAGGMVVATCLMAAFYTERRLHLSGVNRWALLFFGAVGYLEIARYWLRAWRKPGAVDYGEMHGLAARADAVVLMEDHGWTAAQLVNRHLMVAALCALALAAVYAWVVKKWGQSQFPN